MTYATLYDETGKITAVLTEKGWIGEDPRIARSLNALASPIPYTPADGDRFALAANKAAAILKCTFKLTPLTEPHKERVY